MPSNDTRKAVAGVLLRSRNRLIGLDRYREPLSYFRPGGLDQAVELCTRANRDFLAFVRPPAESSARGAERRDLGALGSRGVRVEHWSFDSPMPSGDPVNDRVQLRLYRPTAPVSSDRVLLFHHPVYQRQWNVWEWFLAPLIRRMPLAVMAAPYHFERTGAGRFPGEGTVNPNPARLFESMRQWCWDHQATVGVLRERCGLRVAAEIGYSLGGFQILLLASADRLDLPLITMSATNRYAYGLTHGIIGKGLLASMREVGIDERRLFELTDAVQLERYVDRLRGRPVLQIRGLHDWVDPPPSLDRLEQALRPTRSVKLWAGHGTLMLHRGRVLGETERFLEEVGVLPPTPSRERPPRPLVQPRPG